MNIVSENLPIARIIDNNDVDPSKHDRMLLKQELSKDELEIVRIIFRNKMQTTTKAVAFSWILNFEPYCYFEDQLKNDLL